MTGLYTKRGKETLQYSATACEEKRKGIVE